MSPYRLAAHLTSAFAIYSGLFWTALSVVSPYPTAAGEAGRAAMRVRQFAVPVAAIVGITAISGAFVAGNDAVSPTFRYITHSCSKKKYILSFLFLICLRLFVSLE